MFMCVCIHGMCVQKPEGVSSSKLELQMAVSRYMGPRTRTQVIWKTTALVPENSLIHKDGYMGCGTHKRGPVDVPAWRGGKPFQYQEPRALEGHQDGQDACTPAEGRDP